MGIRKDAGGCSPKRRLGRACAASLLLLLVAGAAAAFALAPRHAGIVVDQSEAPARVDLTPAGLAVEGRITPTTPLRFAVLLAAAVLLDADGRTVIALDSRGGNLDAALLMRRLVRMAQGLTTVDTWVGRGRSCQSACAALFAAGASRVADRSALFMFHAPTFTGQAADPATSSRAASVAERAYLDALAEADPAFVRALKAGGAFDSTLPRYAQASRLVAGGWRFVTRLDQGDPAEGR